VTYAFGLSSDPAGARVQVFLDLFSAVLLHLPPFLQLFKPSSPLHSSPLHQFFPVTFFSPSSFRLSLYRSVLVKVSSGRVSSFHLFLHSILPSSAFSRPQALAISFTAQALRFIDQKVQARPVSSLALLLDSSSLKETRGKSLFSVVFPRCRDPGTHLALPSSLVRDLGSWRDQCHLHHLRVLHLQVRAPASVPFPSRDPRTLAPSSSRICRAGKSFLSFPSAIGSFRFVLHLHPETETPRARTCCLSLAFPRPFRPRGNTPPASHPNPPKHISPRCRPGRTRVLDPEMLTRVLLRSPRNNELLNPELKVNKSQSRRPDQRSSLSQLLRALLLPPRRPRSVVPCPKRLCLRPRPA
jgi:hypothetical protein